MRGRSELDMRRWKLTALVEALSEEDQLWLSRRAGLSRVSAIRMLLEQSDCS